MKITPVQAVADEAVGQPEPATSIQWSDMNVLLMS